MTASLAEPKFHLYEFSRQQRQVVEQMVASLGEGKCVILLGPRYSGKSKLIAHVERVCARELGCAFVDIDLSGVNAATHSHFFAALAGLAAEKLSQPVDIPHQSSETHLRVLFRNLLLDGVKRLGRDVVLVLDHLEAQPGDVLQPLLTLLRSAYMEGVNRRPRLMIVLSGALSLTSLAAGETSPFRNIARTAVMGELSEEESRSLIESDTPGGEIWVFPRARELLLQAAQGDPHLLVEMCRRSMASAGEVRSRQLTVQTVNRVINRFLKDEALGYPPFVEALRMIEDDPHLLSAILALLERPVVYKRELDLPLSPDLDPLYLTGVVSRAGEDGYRLRNTITRQFLQRYFDPGRVGYVLNMAGRWDEAIHSLRSSLATHGSRYRPDLLGVTISAMYAMEDVKRAAYYLRLGLEAVFGAAYEAKDAPVITKFHTWFVYPSGNTLQLVDGEAGKGEPHELALDDDRLEARGYREALPMRSQEAGGSLKRVLPLLIPGQQEVVGVVAMVESRPPAAGSPAFSAPGPQSPGFRELDSQLLSYLNQAARALKDVATRENQKKRLETQRAELQQKASQLSLLNRVSALSQVMTDLEKILNMILTGITAYYGLGYNRAWIFRLDRERSELVGCMGIGDLDRQAAHQAWRQAQQVDFDAYVERLMDSAGIQQTPVDLYTRGLRIPVYGDRRDPFSEAIASQKSLHWARSEEHPRLPPEPFQRLFEVEEFYTIPLLSRRECLGLIVADSKFSAHAYTPADEQILVSFGNQAAAAIVNDQRRSEERQKREIAETLTDIASNLTSSLELKRSFLAILEQMRRVLPFDTASIQLLNDSGSALKIAATQGFEDPQALEAFEFKLGGNYPNVQVLNSRAARRYPDVQQAFIHFSEPQYQVSRVHGWLGVPLIVDEKAIGVITLDSYTPGLYTDEHQALAMAFAGQAAIALQNARIYQSEQAARQAIQQRMHQLERLRQAGEAITRTTTRGIKEALNHIARAACEVTGADCAVIYPFDPDERLYDVHRVGTHNLYAAGQFSPRLRQDPTGMASLVQAHGRLVVDEVAAGQDREGKARIRLEENRFLEREAVRSFVGLSLYVGKEVVGVLFVNFRTPHVFQVDELDTIGIFANQAAVAILQARLFHRGEKDHQAIVATQEITRLISGAETPQQVWQKILAGAAAVTGAEYGRVYLWDRDLEQLELVECSGYQEAGRQHLEAHPPGDCQLLAHVVQRQESILVVDTAHDPLAACCHALFPEIESRLAAPILRTSERRTAGVILLESRQWAAFDAGDKRLLETLAVYAGIAIHNTRLYAQVVKKAKHMEALYQAGMVITASVGLEREQILAQILEEAVESVTAAVGQKATLGTIHLWDEQTRELYFCSVYPPGLAGLDEDLVQRLPLDRRRAKRGRIGVIGRAARTRQAQFVRDVASDPDYLPYHTATRTEVAVPLLDGERLVGVLDVESVEPGAFDDDDFEALKSLANLAVVAIKNAETAQQLSRTNAVAILGAWGADVTHDVNREVNHIRLSSLILQRRPDMPEEARRELLEIDRHAGELAMPAFPEQILAPGQPRASLRDALIKEPAPVDEVARVEVERIRPAYPHITWELEAGCPGATVNMHERWVRRVMRHLLRNAAKAIPGAKAERRVVVRTRLMDDFVEVQVEDSGTGIPPEIEPRLFRQPVYPQEGGMGRGLLLVAFLIEQHGGDIGVLWNRPGRGACFALKIPVSQPAA